MNSVQANNKHGSQLKNDYAWRYFKVKYIIFSTIIVLIIFVVMLIANQQITCETTSSESWGQLTHTSTSTAPNISTSCLSASARGNGINMAIILIPSIIAIAGYKLLPRLYIYLKPNSKN